MGVIDADTQAAFLFFFACGLGTLDETHLLLCIGECGGRPCVCLLAAGFENAPDFLGL